MTERVETPSSNGAGADIDAVETTEWLEAVDAVVEHDGPDRARQILARAVQRAQLAGSGPIASITTPYVNTIPPEREAKLRAIRCWSGGCVRSFAGTRWRWSCARTSCPPSSAATSRASSRSRRCTRSATTTSGTPLPMSTEGTSCTSRATPRRATTRARILEGRLTEEQLDNFRQEVDGRRPVLLSAPVADAGVLAVPDGVARDRRDHVDLPGPVHEVPRGARRRRDRRAQGVGVPRRRRDGRARDDGRDRARRPRAARQPDLGRELQPAAARRPGARQRQDHPGARGRLPRRRLERDQGRVGDALGSAARRRTPTAAWSG